MGKAELLSKILPEQLFMYRRRTSGKELYLTFDDGPDPHVTPALLDLLREHKVKATFFCIGEKIEQHQAIVSRLLSEGHTLGNHSYSHQGFHRLTHQGQIAEVRHCEEVLHRVTGQRNHPFRAPQGTWNFSLLVMLFVMRIPCVHWTVDSLDYQKPAIQTLCERLGSLTLQGGELVLFHDDDLLCVKVLEQLLPQWRAEGFELLSL